jgi:hypothetical protein
MLAINFREAMKQQTTRILRTFRGTRLFLSLCAFSLLVVNNAHAQSLDEFQTRTRLAISYKPTKSFTIVPKLLFYTDGNGLDFWRTMIGLEANYRITKWAKLGAEYRFSTSEDRDFHRFRGFAVFDYGFKKKWELNWRVMYQRDQDNFDAEYLSDFRPARDLLRNLVVLNFSPRKRVTYFASTELFQSLDGGEVFQPFRIRPSVGAQRVFKKRHVFGAELYYIRDFGPLVRDQDRLRLGLSYTWRLGHDKGSKKKDGKEEESPAEMMQ